MHVKAIFSRTVVCTIGLFTGLPAWGQTVQIGGDDCQPVIQLDVRERPLSGVLSTLSDTLGFQLQYQSKLDPQLDGVFTGSPASVLEQLGQDASLVVTTAPLPGCPNHTRITHVWVLPGGDDPHPSHYDSPGMQIYKRAHGLYPDADKPRSQ